MSQPPLARNDAPAGIDVYATSKAHELKGLNPGFAYQYASKDPSHPHYVGNYLRQRELGNQVAGYVLMEAWEIVPESAVEQGRKRADDGKSVDTSATHGSMVLIRTPKANAAKAHFINERVTDIQSKALETGERAAINRTLFGAKVVAGDSSPTSSEITGGK